MFELVRANKRRSFAVLVLMLLLLLLLGFAIGSAFVPSLAMTEFDGENVKPHWGFDPTAGMIGMAVAGLVWIFQALLAYFQGDSILLSVSRARAIGKNDHPQLHNVVEEMCIAAGLPKKPSVYIIEDMSMNAFAAGRSPERASIAVTAGLLARLNRDQLQGVVGHEISHIVNRDILFMTIAGVMVGTIIMLSDVFLRSLRHMGGTTRYRSSKKSGGGAHAIILVIALVLAIIAPILAQLLYFACSRRREYLADAGSAIYTRYPEGLASALETLESNAEPVPSANRATAPMYIINPLKSSALGLTSTHPPTSERIKVLRSLAGGVSYQAYQAAWANVSGHGMARMPASALNSAPVAQREAHPGAQAPVDAKQRMRDAGDLLRKVNQFVFLTCACGMKIKLPPEFRREHVQCPRCQRSLAIPVAQIAAAAGIGEVIARETPPRRSIPMAKPKGGLQPLEVTRQGSGWSSYKCSCGAVNSISPAQESLESACQKCGRKVIIKIS